MYTDCPACQRQFHIYAAQLSAAGGEVKCGYCGQQFNALQRLYDKPLPRAAAAREDNGVATAEEPQFIIPEQEEPVVAEPDDPLPVSNSPVSNHRPAVPSAGTAVTRTSGRHSTAAGIEDEFAGIVFSEEMLEEPEPRPGLASRLLWGSGICLFLLAGIVQVLWFNRDQVMSRYPETRSWYLQICERLDCEYIRHRDLSRIVLVNRDVRDHPRYRDALLVNATMSNQSHTLQPFPLVQLNLYTTGGELIAYRRFSPAEYLDASIDLQAGMQPGVPVHFVLEVLGSVEGAVSFEFEFL